MSASPPIPLGQRATQTQSRHPRMAGPSRTEMRVSLAARMAAMRTVRRTAMRTARAALKAELIVMHLSI